MSDLEGHFLLFLIVIEVWARYKVDGGVRKREGRRERERKSARQRYRVSERDRKSLSGRERGGDMGRPPPPLSLSRTRTMRRDDAYLQA